jgi:hypothetical protein
MAKTNDMNLIGAFVAAPVGAVLWGFGALGLRLAFQFIAAKVTGQRFDSLDVPDDGYDASGNDTQVRVAVNTEGKFF